MNRGTIKIEGSAITLKDPSGTEIQAVKALFKKMFGVAPVIRIRGMFHQDAVKGGVEKDLSVNLTNGTFPVLFVGRLYVTVDLGAPLGSESVRPDLGSQVEVRLALPQEE